jgi:hypothetical protein
MESLLLCSAFTLVGPPEEAPYGELSQPAYSIDKQARPPYRNYQPRPGDVLLTSNPHPVWSFFYTLAGTGAPGHAMLVVRMADGSAGVVEAGYNDKPVIRLSPLDQRLREYPGTIWVRQRKSPITSDQSQALTQFAETIDGRPYSAGRLLAQITPFRDRGPLRTRYFGRPRGIRSSYLCSEAVLEGLVHAGLLDPETTRPSSTYPRDMFFDSSPNPYLDEHPALAEDWEPPALLHRER